ncbi:MAG: asparaginase, partial [Pseudomonadota bacterium]
HSPSDQAARVDLVRSAENPDQRHNNCSGKHTGFLTLCKHLEAGLDYIDPDHPVQRAVRTAVEETTQETVSGFAIDGCSAPNFACSLAGLARAMAHFANAPADSAEAELAAAMVAHPLLVAGHGKSTAELMDACNGSAAVKTGAEGVYVGILPGLGKGFAVKATCGTTRAAEAVTAALLSRLKVLDPNHPAALKRNNRTIRNFAGLETGRMVARLGA